MNGRTPANFPIGSKSTLIIQKIDTYCLLRSILASTQPVDDHPNRATKYEPYRNELKVTNLDFTNGMKNVNIIFNTKFEVLNPKIPINVFEYSIEEDNDYTLVPLYNYKNNENRRNVVSILFKNLYILLQKLHVFIGKQDSRYVCRNCLNCYSNQSELTTHEILCGNNDKSVYIHCKETHVNWDNFYQKIPIYSNIIADFEAENQPMIVQGTHQRKTIDIYR